MTLADLCKLAHDSRKTDFQRVQGAVDDHRESQAFEELFVFILFLFYYFEIMRRESINQMGVEKDRDTFKLSAHSKRSFFLKQNI